uniref:Ig-like domain-containing protein n=1 Tax=Angiostrongylus cantonensis TaxID=6313 RepID=A0A0K0D3S3_ANGCA
MLIPRIRLPNDITGHNDFDYGDGISAEGLERNPIRLSSKHLDPENTLILRQGKPLMIECVYARDDIADISDLQWHKKGARPIDGGSSSRKKNLHFTAIHKRDEGFYQCRARNLGGIMFSREVRVIVLNEITWNDESHSVGALVGEPLTIDCGVKGNEEHHQITITDNEGESLDGM